MLISDGMSFHNENCRRRCFKKTFWWGTHSNLYSFEPLSPEMRRTGEMTRSHEDINSDHLVAVYNLREMCVMLIILLTCVFFMCSGIESGVRFRFANLQAVSSGTTMASVEYNNNGDGDVCVLFVVQNSKVEIWWQLTTTLAAWGLLPIGGKDSVTCKRRQNSTKDFPQLKTAHVKALYENVHRNLLSRANSTIV